MIGLIWQKDWSTLGYQLAHKLAAAEYEVRFFIKNGQQYSKGSSKSGSRGGAKGKTGPDPTETELPTEVIRADSLRAAIKDADVVITLMNTAQEVEDIYLGSGGIFENALPASMFIDLSTSNPRLAREIHALAAVHDHRFVDAPLDGNADMFQTGNIRIYVAGEPDNLKTALPILHALTPDVLEAGLPGCGSTMKLASQIALANVVMGVVEAITFSLVSGLEGEQILKALELNPAARIAARAFGKKMIDEEFYYGLELQQFFFDLSSALDAADEYGLALPGLETAHQLYDLLVLVGGAKKSIHALALIYYEEDRCTRHGLNWELAQQAMDVYERANDGVYDDLDYDDECDDEDCRYHSHHRHDGGPPTMSRYFSSN